MTKKIFFIILISISSYSFSQNNLIHIVKAGETIVDLAKLYKVDERAIEKINNTDNRVKLNVGQKIVIPLGNSIVSNTPKPVANPVNNTITNTSNQYKVLPGDNLSKIAKAYKVSEAQIMEWNNMQNNIILIGQVLFVTKPANNLVKKAIPALPKTPIINQNAGVNSTPTTNVINNPPITDNQAPPVIEVASEIKKESPKSDLAYLKIDENSQLVNSKTAAMVSAFENSFTSTGSVTNVNVATFKTGAGWQDKKYYVLSNVITPGTVVKLTYKNKFTYAKVLGDLPSQPNENQVQARISTATAASIGAFDPIFNIEISY